MWFALIVPGMLAAVWIWPELRIPTLWFGLCVVILMAAAVWLGMDLRQFLATRETSDKAIIRPLFTLYMSSDTPVLPLVLGSFVTGLICVRRGQVNPRPTDTDVDDPAVAND